MLSKFFISNSNEWQFMLKSLRYHIENDSYFCPIDKIEMIFHIKMKGFIAHKYQQSFHSFFESKPQDYNVIIHFVKKRRIRQK
jgi:hypothetical protein